MTEQISRHLAQREEGHVVESGEQPWGEGAALAPSSPAQPPRSTALDVTQPRLRAVPAPSVATAVERSPATSQLTGSVERATVWETPREASRSGGVDSVRLIAVALTLIILVVALLPVSPGDSALLVDAAQARASYRYDLALRLYAQAHSADPGDPRPLCATGDTLILQRALAQAAQAYLACAQAAPSDGSAWLRLGDAREAAGDASGAAAGWTRAWQAGDADGASRLATAAEQAGQLAAARVWWERLPASDTAAKGHLALLALGQGDTAAARTRLLDLSNATDDFTARMRAAGVFTLAFGPSPAPGSTSAAASAAEQDARLGYMLLTLEPAAVALPALQRAVRLDPANGSAHAYYGWALWLTGQRAQGRREVAAGLADAPGLAFAYYAAGEVALADGHGAHALVLLEFAAALDSTNPVAWAAAGDAALAIADYTTARLSYQNAAQASNDPAYAVKLIQFLLTTGIGLQDGSALQAGLRASDRFPDSEPLQSLLGQIYDAIGQQADAYYAFDRARTLDPSDPTPWLYLGRYALASGDIAPGVVDLRTAISLWPTGPDAATARQALAAVDGYTL